MNTKIEQGVKTGNHDTQDNANGHDQGSTVNSWTEGKVRGCRGCLAGLTPTGNGIDTQRK